MPAAAELPDPSQTFSANPLWSVLARCLDCVLLYKTQAQGRRHINIGESRGFLKAEKKLGLEKASARQLFGLDSQVCLGCICKGRSASESLNQELCRSLPTILFHDSYSECMYYQSAENPADDPTRDVELREVYGSLGIDGGGRDIYAVRVAKVEKVGFHVDEDGFTTIRPCLSLFGRSLSIPTIQTVSKSGGQI